SPAGPHGRTPRGGGGGHGAPRFHRNVVETEPMHPLRGVRVIECGIAVAGPVAASYLARLGAEVIKIESRAAGRGIGNRPPAWAPADLGPAAADLGAGNNTFNSEKTSLGLELKTAEGQAVLDRLFAVSDVFLTNLSAPAIATL